MHISYRHSPHGPAGPRVGCRAFSGRTDLPGAGSHKVNLPHIWNKDPVSQRACDKAYVTNAAVDIHSHDTAIGYWFVSDETETESGITTSERSVCRLCSLQRIWAEFSKKLKLNRKAGPPEPVDLVPRDLTATRANQLWLKDLTERRDDKCGLLLCAIKASVSTARSSATPL